MNIFLLLISNTPISCSLKSTCPPLIVIIHNIIARHSCPLEFSSVTETAEDRDSHLGSGGARGGSGKTCASCGRSKRSGRSGSVVDGRVRTIGPSRRRSSRAERREFLDYGNDVHRVRDGPQQKRLDGTARPEPVVCHSPVVHVAQVGSGQAVGISAPRISGTSQGQADGPAPTVGRTAATAPERLGRGQAPSAHPPEHQVLVSVHGHRVRRRRRRSVVGHVHRGRPRQRSAKRTGRGGRFPVRLAAVRKRHGRPRLTAAAPAGVQHPRSRRFVVHYGRQLMTTRRGCPRPAVCDCRSVFLSFFNRRQSHYYIGNNIL